MNREFKIGDRVIVIKDGSYKKLTGTIISVNRHKDVYKVKTDKFHHPLYFWWTSLKHINNIIYPDE